MPSDTIPAESSSVEKPLTKKQLERSNRQEKKCQAKELHYTQEAGAATLVALDDQREKLGNVEKGMDKINDDMKEADKLLSALEQNQSNSDTSCFIT